MFTVIVLSEWASSRFEQWKELFEPYEQDGSVVFCEWNQRLSAHRLTEAVPDLVAAINGKDDWRLLVVGTGTEGLGGEQAVHPHNPFDYLDSSENESTIERELLNLKFRDSKHPIVRLAHMLLGYPPLGAKSFLPDSSFLDLENGERVYQSDFVFKRTQEGQSTDSAVAQFRGLLPVQNDVRVHYKEMPFSDRDKSLHSELSKRYEVKQSRPNDLVLIAAREPFATDPLEQLRSAWKQAGDAIPSRFVERNHYPSSCRFAVFDLHSQGHSAFELGELKFWLSVLSIATNDVPPSAFQSERLHQISVELDSRTLGSRINAHLSVLEAAKEILEAELRKPRDRNVGEVTEILQQRKVAVSFDRLDGDSLSVNTTGFGLASDSPRSEVSVWSESFNALKHESDVFARRPRRVLTQAVEDARRGARKFPERVGQLTKIERDELNEALADRTARLAERATMSISNRTRLTAILERNNKEIRAVLVERMSKGTIALASLVILFAWLAGFTPYLIQSWGAGSEAFIGALVVCSAVIGILLLVAILLLLFMRLKLTRLLRSLNRELKSYVNSVKSAASEFGSFLTDLQTYMYGRSVLDHDAKLVLQNQIRQRHIVVKKKRIIEKMETEKKIVRSLGMQVLVEREAAGASDVRSGDLEKFNQLLLLPRGQRFMTLNNSGETLDAPYDFVARLNLVSLGLREPEDIDMLLEEEALAPDFLGLEGESQRD